MVEDIFKDLNINEVIGVANDWYLELVVVQYLTDIIERGCFLPSRLLNTHVDLFWAQLSSRSDMYLPNPTTPTITEKHASVS